MILSNLRFFLTEALIGMRRSGLMIIIAVGTVIVSLLVFGFFLLGTVNLQNLSKLLASQLEVRLFLNDALTIQEIRDFEDKVRDLKGIKTVTFVHHDEAWTEFRENFHNLNLSESVRENPLPHSLRIQVDSKQSLVEKALYLKQFEYYVEEVVYGGEIAKRVELFSRAARLGGLVLVLLLGVSTLLIIVNTIRLTVIARQDEIDIMKLVGATDSFIKWPFLIEGCIIGGCGAASAIALLRLAYKVLIVKVQDNIPFMPLVFNESQLWPIYYIIGATGAFLGVLGAYISVSKSLKNQL